MFLTKMIPAVLALTSTISAALTTTVMNHAVVTLDLTARHEVLVPGGLKLGVPVTNVDIQSRNPAQFNGSCSGYSWTVSHLSPSLLKTLLTPQTTFGANTNETYVDVEVRLICKTADNPPVPFYVLETGSGKDAAHALRRIHYEIGAPYEHLKAEFFVAEVLTPAPALTLDVHKITQ
jgi:hypothetical protein